MKFGKFGIVLVVLIALVGIYYFYPNLLSSVNGQVVRLTPRCVNVPDYIPSDVSPEYLLDGAQVDGAFIVEAGSAHYFTFRGVYPTGAIYSSTTWQFTAPTDPGNYYIQVDGTSGVMTVVPA